MYRHCCSFSQLVVMPDNRVPCVILLLYEVNNIICTRYENVGDTGIVSDWAFAA